MGASAEIGKVRPSAYSRSKGSSLQVASLSKWLEASTKVQTTNSMGGPKVEVEPTSCLEDLDFLERCLVGSIGDWGKTGPLNKDQVSSIVGQSKMGDLVGGEYLESHWGFLLILAAIQERGFRGF
ncbi:hypothetical protein U1Q18_005034 [Sarracenia purpurea var. burkii]